MKLASKVALITGGATGMGRAIADSFVSEGCDVVICGLPDNPLEEAVTALSGKGPRVMAIGMDQGNVNECVDAVAQTCKEFDGLDILVNCAAALGEIAPVSELDESKWEQALQVNLRGLMVLCRESVRWMKNHGGGSIVNIASAAAKTGVPNRAPYVTSKWGMLGFGQTLALEVARDNIRVNTICPGVILTERLLNTTVKQMASARGISENDFIKEWSEQAPMGRFATVEEIASTAVFLASDMSSGITGQSINVSAGQNMD
jgi:3-hydroxybutyrate dehydrogenase